MKLEIIVTRNLINFSSVIVLFILTTLILLVSSFSVSSLVLFWTLFIILKFLIKDDKLMTLFSFTLGVIFMVGLYHYWTIFYGNSYFLGAMSDDWQYDIYWTDGYISKYGISIYGLFDHLNDLEPGLGILHNSQAYVMFVIYIKYFASFFDGYHTFLPRMLNIFFLTLTAYYSSIIAYNQSLCIKTRRLTFLCVFFFPVLLFNSSHVFRDIIISFILIYIYYISSTNKFFSTQLIKIILLLIILFFLRRSTFLISLVIISFNYTKITSINTKLISVIMILIFIGVFYMYPYIQMSLNQIEAYNEINAERFGTIGSAIFSLPLYLGFIPRYVYLIFTPIPNFSGFHQVFVSISAFIQIFSFPYLVQSFRLKNIDVKIKLTFLILFSGVAFSSGDFRHVMMYMPFGIILTVISYIKIKKEKNFNNSYYRLIAFLFVMFFSSIILALSLK
jgi:hypothetical protein